VATFHPLSPAARQALVDAHLGDAERTIREVRRSLAGSFGTIYSCVCLPAPWGAAHVYTDGRVTDPYGREIPELPSAAK
jgi:hypothetical protein